MQGFASDIKIKDFSCGDYFSAAISTEGKLYTWYYYIYIYNKYLFIKYRGYGNDG